MSERPILFSAPMILAILDGRKSVTRRIVKPDPGPYWNPTVGLYNPTVITNGGYEAPGPEIYGASDETQGRKCPYGQPGGRLWVREAIRLVPDQEPDDGTGPVLSAYDADGVLTVADAWPWKRRYLPPMHCPRGLSRIMLEIVSVRVERLQDINGRDADAEGAPRYACDGPHCPDGENGCNARGCAGAREWYEELWNEINGADSWAANPWVWCIEFSRVTP